MRDIDMLHDLLKKQCPQINQKRLNSLIIATKSLLDGNQLSLKHLERNMKGNVVPKQKIKRTDRLLGNLHLTKDKFAIYQWHALCLCYTNPMPIIIVDWSDVREQLRMFTIRASIVDAVSTSFSIRRISKAISSPRIANRYLSLLINRES